MSAPVWMYRNGEAKLFASPDEVPKGKGWSDSPAGSSDETSNKSGKQAKAAQVDDGNSKPDSDAGA